MAEKEIELTPKVYTFAAIGAVIFGVAGAWAFAGTPAGIVSPALVGPSPAARSGCSSKRSIVSRRKWRRRQARVAI